MIYYTLFTYLCHLFNQYTFSPTWPLSVLLSVQNEIVKNIKLHK